MTHILLIEDDIFIQDIYRRTFESAGYQVTTASDGEEGLTKALAQHHDLILLDIMLPKKTGIEVLAELRKKDSPVLHTPIILITNLGQEDIISKTFAMGADGYMIKAQIRPAEALRAVNDLMKQIQHSRTDSELPK